MRKLLDGEQITIAGGSSLDAEMIRDYALHRVPAQRILGTQLVSMGNNDITLHLDWQECLVGDPETGALMGGVITTLIDHASGLSAGLATLGKRHPEATLDLRIDYLKPSRRGIGVRVHAECYKTTRHIAFVRSSAWHADDPEDLIATSVCTFILTDASTGAT